MNTRLIAAVLILCLASFLVAACSEDDSPADPGIPDNGGNGGTGGEDPALTAVSPPGAAVGLTVKIIGTDLGTEQGSGGVKVAAVDAVIESWSATEIEFTVPAGVPGNTMVGITVTTRAGKTVSSQIDITPPNTYRVTTDNAQDQYPCWSAGADWIYFNSTRSGGANWDIYRIAPEGGEAQRLTFYDGPDFYPDVNTSSGEVAWSSTENHLGNNYDGDFELFNGYLTAGPGGYVTKGMITQNVSRDLDPGWAYEVHAGYNMTSTWEEVDQDGNFLAWKVMLHGSGAPEELTEGRQPNFSGDGRWVVYNHEENIYKMETVGGTPIQLTDIGRDSYPHWGRVNDKIVFQRSSLTGNAEDVCVMNSDGTDVQELIATRDREYCPTWSPDCSKIVYYAHRFSIFDIYVYVVP